VPIQICCTLQSTALLGKVSDLKGRADNSKDVCQFNRQQVFAVMPCNSALRGNEFFHIVFGSIFLSLYIMVKGAWGSVVVKALRC